MEKKATFILALVFYCLTAAPAASVVIYVDCSATGNNDGSSWTDAFDCLQDALAAAKSKDRIYVARGIYKPDRGDAITSGDRTATFQLINKVAIYGGFAGLTGQNPNTRDPNLYETILSGDLTSNDVGNAYDPSRNDNSYHVVTGSGTDETAVLDGFTISAGDANDFYRNSVGGGMYNYYASPTLTNCTFTGNAANDSGGAVFNHESTPVLTGCKFIANFVRKSSHPQQHSKGGAMYNQSHSDPNLIGCTFTDNLADGAYSFGGGIANDNSKPSLVCCKFSNNSAAIGGAMYNDDNSSPTLTKCAFSANSATLGGAVANAYSSPLITRSIFSANQASYGGAISSYYSNPSLISCVLSGNSASYAGGLLSHHSGPRLYYCTFSGNLATFAGGMYSYRDEPIIINSIFWQNSHSQIRSSAATVVVLYSNIQGGWEGQGNIDTDPCFVEMGYWDANGLWVDGDYHLISASACIDAGHHVCAPEFKDIDFDGRPRMIGEQADMGAYEFNYIPVADPGPKRQNFYAWIDGIAQVALDASRTYDREETRLFYHWTRLEDDRTFTTQEPITVVELPLGQYTYELIVSDGIDNSEPNQINITVIRPMSANLRILPRVIDRHDGSSRIIAVLILPEGVTKRQIDCDQSNPPRLYPGDIGAVTYSVIEYISDGITRTLVFAVFSKNRLLDALSPGESMVKLQFVGQFRTGRYYYGSDVVEITNVRWRNKPYVYR